MIEDCGYHPNSEDFEGWSLIFEEDFDQDLSQWTAWESGAFNEELQYYQSDNALLKDGFLVITARREKAQGYSDPFNQKLRDFDFTSARLESNVHYGPEDNPGKRNIRFSARLRLVEGYGLWPAWWTYNDPWPTKGEIDILEARGNTPYYFQSCFHYGSQVNSPETNAKFNEAHYVREEKLSDCFHLYELEWSKDQFIIKFDGNIVKSYDEQTYQHVDEFFGHKHKLVLNLAVGGWFFEEVDTDLIPDQSYIVVDWVRVYER